MAELPYMQFYPGDWMADCQVLSLAGRGAWQTIICKAWHPSTRGVVSLKLPSLARLLGSTEAEAEEVIAEIKETGIADIERAGDVITITSRRIVREWNKRTEERKALSEGGKLGAQRRWGKRDQTPVDAPPNDSPDSPPISMATSRPMANQRLEARDQKLEREEAHEPLEEQRPANPLLPTNPAIEPYKAKLRHHAAFAEAWYRWKSHLSELEKPMTRQQEDSVIVELAKKGPERAAEILGYSITKGAKNPIYDAPKGKATVGKSSGSPEPDPEGFKRWLSEAYPAAEPMPFAQCPEGIQIEFRQSRRNKR